MSDAARSIFERLYFLSGILLVLSVGIAIWQIRLQRNLSKVSARRESYRIAAERCEYFGREILPLEMQLKKEMEDAKCDFLKKCKIEVSDDSIKLDPSALTPEDAEKINKHSERLSRYTNSLEGFAVFFVTGVADDNVGFLTCGRAFVKSFEEWFPVYALSDSLEHHAKATQTLYAQWSARIRQLELVAQQEEIKRKLDPKKAQPKKPYGG